MQVNIHTIFGLGEQGDRGLSGRKANNVAGAGVISWAGLPFTTKDEVLVTRAVFDKRLPDGADFGKISLPSVA